MSKSKNYIIADTLEIFYKDLPSGKTFDQYNSLCLALKGDGWRIPTIKELSYMYGLHTLGILEFDNDRTYFSSSHSSEIFFKCINFSNGDVIQRLIINTTSFRTIKVRPVRTIHS